MKHFFTNTGVRAVLAGTMFFAISVPRSWGWGHEGHRLTALVAEAYLNAQTRAQIAELLGVSIKDADALADIASWADDYRQEHPETAPWHYVDIPLSATAFDRMRDCPAPTTVPASPWRDCATDRILYFEGRLGDTSLSLPERAMALKFLVHLIGDVHQPMHTIGDARGGNENKVTFLGSARCGTRPCNLHSVWDDSLIEERGLSETKYTARLIEDIKQNHWERLSGGEPTGWANVSHRYAVNAFAPNGALLQHDYYNEEIRVVDSQLALGGLRLAHVLNRILGETEQVPGRTVLPKSEGAGPSF